MESVEASGFGNLDFSGESLSKVLENDTVRCSEESKHMLDEMLLIIMKLFPILKILCKINLLSCPESSLLILVHLPDIMILNREEHESVGVLLKKWLWDGTLSLSVVTILRSSDWVELLLALNGLHILAELNLSLLLLLNSFHLLSLRVELLLLGIGR